jgi:tRNA U34 5-carboxymethylaminomethyl modifying enzyme MnmG/GidA
VGVQQKHQEKVARIDQWASYGREELIDQAQALQGKVSTTQQNLDGAKERLVQKSAAVDAADLELAELHEAAKAENKARITMTGNNSAYQQYLKRQNKELKKLEFGKAAAMTSKVSWP